MRLNLRVWMLCQNLPLQRFACISGGVGPRLGLSVERVTIIFARCCQIQNLSYGTSLHRHPLFLFSMILMSLIESDYDLYDFDDS